jgi:hypothetical protein
MDNLDELMAFLEANREKTFGGRIPQYAFNALITYYHSSKTTTFFTEVRVDTAYESGKIILAENDQCTSDKFHLSFQPEYQNMYFDRELNILIISGNSKTMGGYKVSISALVQVDVSVKDKIRSLFLENIH